MASVLDEALFSRPEDTRVPPVDPDSAGGEESLLVELVSLLGGDGLGANCIAVREKPPGPG